MLEKIICKWFVENYMTWVHSIVCITCIQTYKYCNYLYETDVKDELKFLKINFLDWKKIVKKKKNTKINGKLTQGFFK